MFTLSCRLSKRFAYSQNYSTTLSRAARENVKAVVISDFGDANVLQMGSVTIPTPGDKQCVIKVHACGVNPVDTYIRSGVYPKLPVLPYVPGKDAAGVVESIGKDVRNVGVGDRVYVFGAISGSYAQYALCSDENTFILPNNISFEKGACLGTPAFTAYRALFEKARGRPGELVFVHGASGGVGLMAVQMARASGMRVVGTSGSIEGMKAVKNAGAEIVFNHTTSGYMEAIKSQFSGGFDICIEMLASSNLGKDLPLMGPNGRVAIVGSRGAVEINPRDLMSKELEVHGVALLQSTPKDMKRAAAFVNACLEQGNLDPVVSLSLPLEKASEAHVEVIARSKVQVGNIVLIPPQH